MNNPCVGFGSRSFVQWKNGKLFVPNYTKMSMLYGYAVNLCGHMTEGVHGGAEGADGIFSLLVETLSVPERVMRADWTHFGKPAGVLRNREMAEYVRQQDGFAIGLWDGISSGTKHMLDYCNSWGVPTIVFEWPDTRLEPKVHRFNM